jgi:ABC-type transporter Mla maintaining outer membrane lipid asymmetry ATPase subunit MlaF
VTSIMAHEKVVLDVQGLRMRYGANEVLDDVTFQAHHGEVLALLVTWTPAGCSGSGSAMFSA